MNLRPRLLTTVVLSGSLVGGAAMVLSGATEAVLDVERPGVWLANDGGASATRLTAGGTDATVEMPTAFGNLDVVQLDGVGYAIDEKGGVSRIDPAQIEVSVEAALSASAILVTGGDRLWAVDPAANVVTELSPSDLRTIGTPVAVAGELVSPVADQNGVLWVVDASAGTVIAVTDGEIAVIHQVAEPGRSLRLSVVGGDVAVLDSAARTVTTVDTDGVDAPHDIDASSFDDPLAPELVADGELLPVVGADGSLVTIDVTGGASTQIDLGSRPGTLSAPGILRGKAYIADNATGELLVVDVATGTVERLSLTGEPGRFEVIVKGNHVYVNDRTGTMAWAIGADGTFLPDDKYLVDPAAQGGPGLGTIPPPPDLPVPPVIATTSPPRQPRNENRPQATTTTQPTVMVVAPTQPPATAPPATPPPATQAPATTTPATTVGGPEPVATTDPVESTEAPATDPPVDTTEPVVTTEPAVTTEPPVTTTDPPVTTTDPADTTTDPVDPTGPAITSVPITTVATVTTTIPAATTSSPVTTVSTTTVAPPVTTVRPPITTVPTATTAAPTTGAPGTTVVPPVTTIVAPTTDPLDRYCMRYPNDPQCMVTVPPDPTPGPTIPPVTTTAPTTPPTTMTTTLPPPPTTTTTLPPPTTTIVPAPPTPSVSASAGDGSVSATFSAAGATSYNVELISGGSTVDGTTTASGSAQFSGLANGSSYEVRVSATNAGGPSAWATSGGVTPVGPPSQPNGVSASVDGSTITVSWGAANGNGGSISNYSVNGGALGSQTTAGLSATFTGVAPGDYTITVAATNDRSQTGPSAGTTVTVLPPPTDPPTTTTTTPPETNPPWTGGWDPTWPPCVTAYIGPRCHIP